MIHILNIHHLLREQVRLIDLSSGSKPMKNEDLPDKMCMLLDLRIRFYIFLPTALQRQGTTVLDCHLKVLAQPNARCLEENSRMVSIFLTEKGQILF